ncbi:ornithine/acetylornithine aminotransferase [Bernardetia litoralis DSM 6794]|uniref:Ornithine/acetylornithine aminotransferase n=1 Tax=Bernardetia litoralis (strain ATCC 23117 / DSM 6794 / NBRC 15988 / NCIMB 1366 / Fx l1 / Sio-4) TaxID=880071 RepID=I4AQY2_BERLS|nr:aminotransferase class III-fold pyridoxal phosphate-dependent enzyme [Bernardetia litoralis]AFM06367.1 ornithine/acetylornithine aminotransferase [Bernardetia litoralis DSM 6794]
MNLFDVYPKYTLSPTSAKGTFIYTDEGKKYLDLYGGHGVISIGHSHSHYVKRISEQLSKIGFYSNSIDIPIQNELAQRLTEQSGYSDYKLFLCNSGAEATENALKLASFHTKKKKVIAFKNSFHGRTAAALNVTDNPKLSAPINENNFEVKWVELNNKNQLQEALSQNDVCAVIIEGIQGVGGLDMATDEYLKFLQDECKKHDSLLILDEIQSGFGRSGKFFAHQWANIQPDLITMAKGMGNGFPIGGVLIHPKIEAHYGMLGTTFGGNHLACAASMAVLEVLENENLLENVNQISKKIIEEFKNIPSVKQVKGKGLMLGIEMPFPIKELRQKLLYDHHIFTGASANPNVLRVLPPLSVSYAEFEPFIKALHKILS